MESAAELIYWGCRSNSEFYEGFITLQYWAVSSCLQQQGGRVYVVIWEGGDMYLVWSGLFTVYNGLAVYSRPAPLLPICVLLCIKCPHSFYSLSLSAVISPDCPEPGCHLQMVSAPLSTHWPPGGAANMGNMTTTYSRHHQWAPPREMLVMISPGCFWWGAGQINSSVYCLHIVPGTKHCCSVVTVLTAVSSVWPQVGPLSCQPTQEASQKLCDESILKMSKYVMKWKKLSHFMIHHFL